jgi:branched-chain amino acid transport system ATP-binding protein
MGELCKIVNASRSFGGVRAVVDFTMSIEEGEMVGIIGPNGSGKTTLLNCVSGSLHFSRGRVTWLGEDITSWPMFRIARSGLVRTFQQSMFFPSRTVAENVRLACELARRPREPGRGSLPSVTDLLDLAGLSDVADVQAASASHGTLRLLGIAMCLAGSPRMLLLDEPAAGLNDVESRELANMIKGIHSSGVSLVVVDHDMSFMMSLVERLVVMSGGRLLTEGRPEAVVRNERVIEVFLGRTSGATGRSSKEAQR